jgi:hypothetical protein
MDVPRSNARAKSVLAIIYVIALTLFVLVKDVAAPLINSATGKTGLSSEARMAVVDTRLDKLEQWSKETAAKVDILLEGQAQRNEAITNLKAVADRIEKKIDDHMARSR